jgi:hypothetical protein
MFNAINPKVHLEAQKIMNSKARLNKKSNAEGITIPDFKLLQTSNYYCVVYSTAIVIKTALRQL